LPAGADPATRRAARQLAEEGGELLDQGRYALALDRLGRAYALVPAPTIRLLEAEAHERLGQLVEAAECLEAVTRTPLDEGAPEAFRNAVAEAGRRLQAIQSRIPTLTVSGAGSPATRPVEVRLGDERWPAALIGVPRPLNPGRYRVTWVMDGEVRETQSAQLAEGQHLTLTWQPPEPGLREGRRGPADEPAPRGRAVTVGAYASFGVAAAGFALGAGAGLRMLSRRDELESRCEDGVCPPESGATLDAFRGARRASFVGWSVGFAGAAVGAGLLLWPRARSTSVQARIAPDTLTISGTF
jgi:hypothetical protein